MTSTDELYEMFDLAGRINKLLRRKGVSSLEEEGLEKKIEGLTCDAKSELSKAVKNEEVHKILSILGFKVTKTGVRGE